MTPTVSARRARDDRGSVTLLMIGATMIVMFVGWIAFTMWNGSNERRQLAAAADQAAQAGATALDAAAFRATGARQLDPALAEQRASESLTLQGVSGLLTSYQISADTGRVTVTLEGEIDIGLLRIFDVDDDPIEVRVTAIGYPQGGAP
jgi:Flp pilus assembly protein TadG